MDPHDPNELPIAELPEFIKKMGHIGELEVTVKQVNEKGKDIIYIAVIRREGDSKIWRRITDTLRNHYLHYQLVLAMNPRWNKGFQDVWIREPRTRKFKDGSMHITRERFAVC